MSPRRARYPPLRLTTTCAAVTEHDWWIHVATWDRVITEEYFPAYWFVRELGVA